MSNDLSIIIDPGGIDQLRDGINLRVYPSGASPGEFQPVGTTPERLANSGLSAGGFEYLYEFSWVSHLDRDEFGTLRALLAWNQNQRINGKPWEVILYNLVEPFSETSVNKTRRIVPGTTALKEISQGFDLTYYEYWVAIQGSLSATHTQIGSKWEVNFTFVEGTFLDP